MVAKRALIVGSAPCVWEDMANAPDWPLIVVNAMGVRILGSIDLWCSVHGSVLLDRMRKRDRAGGDPDYRAYGIFGGHILATEDPRMTVCHRGPEFIGKGSSGLFAVQVALAIGYEELVLCGIPIDGSWTLEDEGQRNAGHIRDMYQNHIPLYQKYQQDWINAEDQLIGKVRSMSGWTRIHFGGP